MESIFAQICSLVSTRSRRCSQIKMARIFLQSFTLVASVHSIANITVPKIFGDNMVLQRNKPIPVWGWADPFEKITVRFDHQTREMTADKDGNWRISLDKEPAGGPFQLLVQGKNTVTFKNVLVGEVWICSGQSNMEMPIEGWGKINNYEQEIANANYPQIRHIKIPNAVNTRPQKDISQGEWKICSPLQPEILQPPGIFLPGSYTTNSKFLLA